MSASVQGDNFRYKKTDYQVDFLVGCGSPDVCEERTDDLWVVEFQTQKNQHLAG